MEYRATKGPGVILESIKNARDARFVHQSEQRNISTFVVLSLVHSERARVHKPRHCYCVDTLL